MSNKILIEVVLHDRHGVSIIGTAFQKHNLSQIPLMWKAYLYRDVMMIQASICW